ncbi:MAG: hypothetical protein ACOX68_02805 [Candidatus Limivicinus sp.]
MKKLSLFMAVLTALLMLAACGNTEPAAAPEPAHAETAAPAETTEAAAVEEPEREPLYGENIADGDYEITVSSSSSMFRVVKCVLTVKDGEMEAVMTMSGQGYGKLFMGTGAEAAEAGEECFIPFVPDEEGAKTFTVPVEALNTETNCAAWSIKKEKWYDRVLVFESDSVPEEAVSP